MKHNIPLDVLSKSYIETDFHLQLLVSLQKKNRATQETGPYKAKPIKVK